MSEPRDAADLIIDSCVAACGEHDIATLDAIANDPLYKDGWPGLMIREYLNVWHDIGARP